MQRMKHTFALLLLVALAMLSVGGVTPPKSGGGITGATTAYVTSTGVGNDTYTKLLLHFDNDNQDYSQQHLPERTTGNPAVPMSTHAKFGGYAGYFANSCPLYPLFGNNKLAANDFTIDFWMWPLDDDAATQVIFTQTNLANYAPIYINQEFGNVRLYYNATGAAPWLGPVTIGAVVEDTAYYHIAVTRSGNNMYTFLNGAVTNTIDVTGITLMTPTQYLEIGCHTAISYYTGYIDELHIDIGVARWTADFSGALPTAAYGAQSLRTTDALGNITIHSAW